jgi:archaemetzincin
MAVTAIVLAWAARSSGVVIVEPGDDPDRAHWPSVLSPGSKPADSVGRTAGKTLNENLGALITLSALVLGEPVDNSTLPPPFRKLTHLHKALGKPGPGDWLANHREDGQTYDEYVLSNPVRPAARRRVIYIQPLGEFTDTQRKIIQLTAEFMGICYQLPVRVRKDLPMSLIPQRARRVHPQWKVPQVLSTYVLKDVLKPRLPADAVAMIAFTASDLWPGENWNFVFGQASLAERVGVWSIHRFGDPDKGEASFRLTLRRTLATAVHETGHMFSLAHCIYYECCMCGSNSLAEADRTPLWFCPQCMAKLCYATDAKPEKRLKELAAFAKAQGLVREEDFWRKSLAAMEEK